MDEIMAMKECSSINLSHILFEQLSSLYLNERDSDIVFLVEGERVFAHKFILTLRCEYFRLMFSSGLKEAIDNLVEVKETSAWAFKSMLNYIYTGQVRVDEDKVDDVIDILSLAHRYALHELVTHLICYLESIIDAQNVYEIYYAANLFSLDSLSERCYQFMLRSGFQIIEQDEFYSLNKTTIIQLFSDDEFCALEIDIFKAVMKCLELNPNYDESTRSQLKATIRLLLIFWDDLIAFVWPSGLFTKDELLATFQEENRISEKDINYRNCVTPIRSIEEVSGGVIEKSAIHQRPYELTNMSIIFSIPGSVTIQLERIHFINYMEINLGNCDKSGYSYYIEAATHENEWFRIVDYTDYHCHGTQIIYFETAPIEYIRFYGTRCNGHGTNFIISSFKCMLKEIPPTVYNQCSKNKSELDYKSENTNKFYVPLYAAPQVDICRSRSTSKFNPII